MAGYQVLNVLKQIEEGDAERRKRERQRERDRERDREREAFVSGGVQFGSACAAATLADDRFRQRERECVCVSVIIGIIVARDARLVVGARTSHGAALRLCAVLC